MSIKINYYILVLEEFSKMCQALGKRHKEVFSCLRSLMTSCGCTTLKFCAVNMNKDYRYWQRMHTSVLQEKKITCCPENVPHIELEPAAI